MQEFAFIRKELLNRYLKESGQRLAWAIYGERALYDGGMGGAGALLGDAPPYARYGKTWALRLSGSALVSYELGAASS